MLKGDDNVEDYLEHHGVQGMRWGVRKASSKSSRHNKTHHNNAKKIKSKATSVLDKPFNRNNKSTKAQSVLSKQKKAKDMSNDELQRAIQRQQLINQYNALTNPKKTSRIQKATKYISSIAKISAEVATIYKALNTVNSIRSGNNTKDADNNKKNKKKKKNQNQNQGG